MELGIWIVWLVRAAWIAAILLMVIGSIPSSKLRLYHELMLSFAGRGKILQPSSSQKWTVPQKYFAHFYVVGVVWTTLLFAMTWMYAFKMAPLTGGSHVEHWFKVLRAVFLLLLMEIHVLRRLIESFYVFKYSPCARMSILGYFTGLFFYAAAPLSLCIDIASEMLGWCQLIGGAFFLWGWLHQRRCHAILVLYMGLLIASGGIDVTIWLLFGFVVGNLTMAAGETHRWYLRKFENYPANRSAIFPYVY
uniref:3-oxo-5-alpha-steroid 4-dehydrogenase C-terminal domain-containing protein n=1 Tax=Brassica oleracea var. oleracea TaxID=109376 RepID=A0A0D3BDZ5_BRAOL